MRFYKKIVITVTIFLALVSGVFTLTGVGSPGLRILVGLIFLTCFLNLSVYARDFGQWSKKVIQAVGNQLKAIRKTEENKPAPEVKPYGPGRAETGGSCFQYPPDDEEEDEDEEDEEDDHRHN